MEPHDDKAFVYRWAIKMDSSLMDEQNRFNCSLLFKNDTNGSNSTPIARCIVVNDNNESFPKISISSSTVKCCPQ